MKKSVVAALLVLMCIMVIGGLYIGYAGIRKPVKVETVKFWSNNGHTKELVTRMVAEYNSTVGKEKGIKIEYTVHSADYKNAMNLAIAAGQAPDLFKTHDLLPVLVQKNAVIPIEEMPGGGEFLKNYEGLLKSPVFMYKGKTYTVPFNVSSLKLIYNKDLFKEAGIVDAKGEAKPPTTWDEVAEYAKKLTNPAKKVYGIVFPMRWPGYLNYELLFPFVSSVGHMHFDNRTGKFNYNGFKPAFEWLLRVKKDKSYFPGAEGLDNDPARAQFAEGRIGMKFGASWDVAVLNDQFPAKCAWGVADLPVLDPDNRYKELMNAGNGGAISTTAKKNNLEKVMEVYKWSTGDEFLARMYEEGKYIPYKDSIVKMAKKQPGKVGWAEFSKIDKGFLNLTDPKVAIEGDDDKKVLEKIWLGIVPVEKALADLDKRYNEALEKAVRNGKIDLEDYLVEDFDISLK